MCLSPDEMRVFNKVIHSFIHFTSLIHRTQGPRNGFWSGMVWGGGGGGGEAKANALARDN